MFDFDVVTGPSSIVRPADPHKAPAKPAEDTRSETAAGREAAPVQPKAAE